MAGHLPQPVNQVRRRLNGPQILVQVQEHILRQILRPGAIAQKMIRDAEYHRLVLAHHTGEGELIAASRLGQYISCGLGRRQHRHL